MALTIEDYRRLEEILLDAFRTYSDLEQMVAHQLGINLEAIASRENLGTTVFDLVQHWAIPKNKIKELVTAALNENPGHEGLQQFCLSMLLIQSGFELEELLIFYYQSMPSYTVIASLPLDAGVHHLISRLAEMPLLEPEKKQPLYTFALLAATHPKGVAVAKEINSWLGLLDPDYLHAHVEPAGNLPAQAKPKINFLSVLVIPTDTAQTTYRIKIFSEQVPHFIIEVEDKKITEIKDLAAFILDALNSLVYHGFDTRSTTVEFFLPFRLLPEAVDQYQMPIPGQPYKLGFLHRVTVRSLDRSQNPYLLLLSQEKWDRLSQCFQLTDQQRLTRVAPFTDFQPLDQLHYKLHESELVCLGLSLIPNNLEQSDNLLRGIIAGGIPIALWIRPFELMEDPIELERRCSLFEQRLRALLFEHELIHLPEHIHQERCKAALQDEDECGNRFTLLWDDPTRVPRLSSLRAG